MKTLEIRVKVIIQMMSIKKEGFNEWLMGKIVFV